MGEEKISSYVRQGEGRISLGDETHWELTGSSDFVCFDNEALAVLISSIIVVRSLPMSSSRSESFSASLYLRPS